MKKIAVLATLGLLALAVSAQAAAPKYTPASPPGSHRCQPTTSATTPPAFWSAHR